MEWILVGFGVGGGYAIISPAIQWFIQQRRYILANRGIGWDVNWRNRQDGMNWKRLPV